MAASWPPTSGATRISVARTTPTIGGAGSGRHSKYPPTPADDEDEAERDDALQLAASHAPASA